MAIFRPSSNPIVLPGPFHVWTILVIRPKCWNTCPTNPHTVPLYTSEDHVQRQMTGKNAEAPIPVGVLFWSDALAPWPALFSPALRRMCSAADRLPRSADVAQSSVPELTALRQLCEIARVVTEE